MIPPVSPSNADIVRSMWAAYARRGLHAVLDFAAPDAEWVPWSAGGRRFRSTAEYRAYLEEMDRRHEIVEATLGEIREYGESVVVTGRLRLRTQEGISDTTMHWVHRLRDGEVVYTASYPRLQQAMDAAGLG
ncbi:MAG TPA: nuclear transport factor 2 family protein [Solirubrobacteraceae bacterium]|jgi:ketosteroid isomerase-like protein|nr:nuclear transport factor 2 family protein [Solirubrobacteraceae bacterium]